VALQLMLKYPAPQPPHGPHTFVDDAIYLRDHPNAAGGVTIIFKYTGRSPNLPTPPPRSSAPSLQGFGSLRQRTLGARSPLSTTAKLLQQPGGVEALLQGATKNMIERGEKLGINQAVRDAVGEIRRNMQGLQDARTPGRGRGISGVDGRPTIPSFAMMEKRNRRLAAMLDGPINDLKLLATSKFQEPAEKDAETLEVAAAKIQFIKQALEDVSLSLPEEELPPLGGLTISGHIELRSPTVALDTTPVVMTSSAVDETRSALSSPDQPATAGDEDFGQDADKMDTDLAGPVRTPHNSSTAPLTTIVEADRPIPTAPKVRPKGPIPTRSTLAQSSFAWMLEPDTTVPHGDSFPPSRPSSSGSTITASHKKRQNPSRERNAFLFGEVVSPGGADVRKPSADEIFGLQPIRKET